MASHYGGGEGLNESRLKTYWGKPAVRNFRGERETRAQGVHCTRCFKDIGYPASSAWCALSLLDAKVFFGIVR